MLKQQSRVDKPGSDGKQKKSSLTWLDKWQYSQFELKFVPRSVYGVLPTPENLTRWNLTDTPNCLFWKRGTLQYIFKAPSLQDWGGTFGDTAVVENRRRVLQNQKQKQYI